MKKNVLFFTVCTLLLMACNQNAKQPSAVGEEYKLDTMKLKAGQKFYQCEMHPEVISDKPGNCPKCGMDLIEMTRH